MTHIDRRAFLDGAARLASGALLAPHLTGATARYAATLADGRVDVLLDETIGTIAPEIYGHFAEHLGGVIYDGIWVGEDSRIPNVNGIRKALIDALTRIRPPVIRWPGGCFADAYDWRDGVGPRDKRPRRTNVWADQDEIAALGSVPAKVEPNTFGTNEFMHLCQLAGAQPYVGANLRTLDPQAFHQWVEYCNAPAGSTTLADLRATGGSPAPFGVRYWGVGNESWGCGGNFTPDEYASEFRRYATWPVLRHGVPLAFIGSGPSGGDWEWTRRFLKGLADRGDLERLWGWALHHYCSAADGEAVSFAPHAWYDLLASADKMEGLITGHWQLMRETDRAHRIKLVVDEWGAWHKMTTNVDPSHLFGQQSTMRDAVVAGLTLDTFNRHADKVAMANVAQLINCIQSLFLAHEDKFLTTPTYHVFAMYAPHQGARAVRMVASAPRVSWTDGDKQTKELWGLAGSASVKGDVLTLTLTNPHATDALDVAVALHGGKAKSIRATTLAHRDLHAHNTFEQPHTVEPTTTEVRTGADGLVHRLLPGSVTQLRIALGV